jgi:DNA-binding transcriptional LysR family regulator
MDRFRSLEVFAASAAHQNFAVAARELKLTRAMVSRHIAELEAHLGTRLFQRTTRRVSLTDAGRVLAARANALIEALGDTENAVRDMNATLHGPLRVNAPVSFGHEYLAPLVAAFLRKHPGVSVDLTLNDRTVDLVEEGYDVVIRVGVPADSSLIARRLAPAHLVIVGSPSYLKARGTPARPEDLKDHNCLGYTYWSLRNEWPLTGPDGKTRRIRVSGSMTSNNGDALRVAALQGIGLILQPTFSVGPDIAAGRLVNVLPGFQPRELTVHALYAPGAAPGARLRAFIDTLATAWSGTPVWDKWMNTPAKAPIR